MSKPMYEVYPGKIANQVIRIEKRKVKILQKRIDKAIEYIKPYRVIEDIGNCWVEFTLEDKAKLLEILGDKENE